MSNPFAQHFYGTGDGHQAWLQLAEQALQPSCEAYSGAGPELLAELLAGEVCPEVGLAPAALQARLRLIAQHSIQPWHPHTAAHLQTPVLLPALAAEAFLSALNQSMDSFDQAPAASVLEQKVLTFLTQLAGLLPTAGGTFTAGGTQSNYMGLLLARDHFCLTQLAWPVREKGLPPQFPRMRFLCSEVAHFSVEKSAIQLGLGLQSVIKVPCDSSFRMSPSRLRTEIASLRERDLLPAAIVATAVKTDFGSIDDLQQIARIAAEENIWLHVDAAYGGALLLSPRHASLLAVFHLADSISIDFHKAFFQPISCSAFLLADQRRFDSIRVHADYLNSESREAEGIPDLVTRSLLTTRRFDALKLWVSFQSLGRLQFAAMIDQLVLLAASAASFIKASLELELLAEPQFAAIVFRFRPELEAADTINNSIPRLLFKRGQAVVGHTVVRGKPCLKITLCNLATTPQEVNDLLALIIATGEELKDKEWIPSLTSCSS